MGSEIANFCHRVTFGCCDFQRICPKVLGDGVDLLGDGVDLLVDGVNLLGEGVDLLGEGVDLLGDGVDLLGDGGDPRSIAVGSSKTTVAQKGDQRLEIRKCDQRTNGLTDGQTDMGRC